MSSKHQILVACGIAASIFVAQAAGQADRRGGVVSHTPDVPRSPFDDGDDGSSGDGSSEDGGSSGGDSSQGDGSSGDGSSSDDGSSGDGDGRGGGSDFQFYFGVTSASLGGSHKWSDSLVFDTELIDTETKVLYNVGFYPHAGPHMAMAPGYLDRHLQQVVLDIEKQIPDPDYSGLAIIDYERFRALWIRTPNVPSNKGPEALDMDFQDDWRDYIRSVNPQFDRMSEPEQEEHLRETFEATVKEFFLATINKCRELRPNAKWSFYSYPYRFFKHRRYAPLDVISYGDCTHTGSDLNDELQWMWDAVDFISPSIYTVRSAVESGDELCGEEDDCTPAEDLEYVQNMIRESERLSGGKPVIPFICTKYYRKQLCNYTEDLNDANLFSQIAGPVLSGADGAILWGHINNAEEAADWQTVLDRRVMPLMRQAIADDDGGGDDGHADGGDDGDNGDNGGSGSEDGDRGVSAGDDSSDNSGSEWHGKKPVRSGSASGVTSAGGKRAPMEFRRETDRISKPRLSPAEIAEARRRAKLAKDGR